MTLLQKLQLEKNTRNTRKQIKTSITKEIHKKKWRKKKYYKLTKAKYNSYRNVCLIIVEKAR